MILMDLFSGYGGFHLGLEQAGFNFTKTYFSEIDKHAIANYRYNFPNAEYLGPVESILESGVRADIITFGSPCQDFSLAGKRAGLAGSRSSLIEYPIGYIKRFRPRAFIWENVKGAFSSNSGADFWAIIQAFANIGDYRLQWQLVNTLQWLPQNRERIYLVGLAGEGSGCEIFPVGQSDGWFNERLSEAASVRTLTAGGHHSGMTLIRHRSDQPYQAGHVAPTLRNSDKAEVRILQTPRGNNKGGEHDDCPTISANSFQHNNHIILQTNKSGQTFEKEEAGTLRSGASANYQVVQINEAKSQSDRIYSSDGAAPTLRRGSQNTGTVTPIIQINPSTESNGKQPFQPMQWRRSEKGKEERKKSKKNLGKDYTPFSGGSRELVPSGKDEIGTITSTAINKDSLLGTSNSIRRLTPTECERLQGLPDGFTKYGNYDGVVNEISDTQRYKLCGNGVSIPPVKAIGEKILRCL